MNGILSAKLDDFLCVCARSPVPSESLELHSISDHLGEHANAVQIVHSAEINV